MRTSLSSTVKNMCQERRSVLISSCSNITSAACLFRATLSSSHSTVSWKILFQSNQFKRLIRVLKEQTAEFITCKHTNESAQEKNEDGGGQKDGGWKKHQEKEESDKTRSSKENLGVWGRGLMLLEKMKKKAECENDRFNNRKGGKVNRLEAAEDKQWSYFVSFMKAWRKFG